MKKFLLVALMAIMFSPLDGYSQEVVTIQGKPPLVSSVVRQYKDNSSVHYCSDVAGNHYFVLFNKLTPTSAIVADFPSYYDVHDFEIFDNVVYFCGTFPRSGNPLGLVGFISIADLFSNNLPYTFGYVENLFFESMMPSDAHLTSGDRLDLFYDGLYVHMAIVGEFEHGYPYGNGIRRTVCDVWYDGSRWNGKILYQKYDYNRPTDITCTDNCYRKSSVSCVDNTPTISFLSGLHEDYCLIFDNSSNGVLFSPNPSPVVIVVECN